MKREKLFEGALAELCAKAFAILIIEAMFPLDVNERNWIRLECCIPFDVWEHEDLSVAAFLQQGGQMHCIRWSPINGQGGGVNALQLRHVVFRANDAFDRSGMCIRQ